jgi:hypothetical protein
MRRLLLIFVLAPLLIGFPTPQVSAGNISYVRMNSFDEVLYWTSDDIHTGQTFRETVGCRLNPDKLWACIEEISLNGRTLEYRPYEEFRTLQNSSATWTTQNPSAQYLHVYGSGTSFACWAPTWPEKISQPVVPINEQCSYRQYNVSFNGNFVWGTEDENPHLTIKVRKVKGKHPASHLGFLHAQGPVHEFIPTSDTDEFATLTISPGLSTGSGSFNTNLQTLDMPEYAWSGPTWKYGFFLATLKVTGAFENAQNIGFEMLPESRGAWQATNAESWGFYGEYWKPDYAIRVAGPHFQYKVNPTDPDVLNTAWFSAYLPRNLVQRQFGLTPERANENTLTVTRSVGRTPTQLPSTFSVVGDGLLIKTDGITFSKPAITIARRISIKKRQRMSVKNIIASAGIPKRNRGTARISSSPCRSSKKNCSITRGKVTFTKPGRYRFQIVYNTIDARKRPLQRRHQVTVRVR